MFTSDRGQRDGNALYIKDVNGIREEELLLQSRYFLAPSDWSLDGRALVYSQLDPKTKNDLWIVRVRSAKEVKPVPFLQTEFNEWQGQFSPDVHWMAYSSDESGRYEVYVRPFPSGLGKWQISTAGGQQPRWQRDGKELFYLTPDRKLMVVKVKAVAGPKVTFEAEAPESLFEAHVPSFSASVPSPRYQYAVTGDGKRFLVQTMVGESDEATITVVHNWLSAVRR